MAEPEEGMGTTPGGLPPKECRDCGRVYYSQAPFCPRCMIAWFVGVPGALATIATIAAIIVVKLVT